MPYKKHRYVCSCCGKYIDKHPDRTFEEGDMCSSCFQTEEMQSTFQYMGISDEISNNLTNPIKRFCWNHLSLEGRIYHINEMISEGVIGFKIGRK